MLLFPHQNNPEDTEQLFNEVREATNRVTEMFDRMEKEMDNIKALLQRIETAKFHKEWEETHKS